MAELRTVGAAGQALSAAAVADFVREALGSAPLDGRSLCVVVPDTTRTAPLPELLEALHGAVIDRVSRLTVLIALGTHQPLSDAVLRAHVGAVVSDDERVRVLNHEWWKPDTFATVGTISADDIAVASDGRLRESVEVNVNREVTEHDIALVIGPVFPHEVIGFSGGNKYFFPGVSGPEVINLSHWLGALITSSRIIGVPGVTPVRRIVNKAAELIPAQRLCLSFAIGSGTHDPSFLAFGTPEDAWAAAAEVAAELNVRYLDRPVRRVLSLVSPRYDDLWTGAKGMYKLDPVVADGGELVIHAPHITVASVTHGEQLARIGYHCRDYFLADIAKFADIPRTVLAHSTHLRGDGTFDPQQGESCRITVTLATGIDEATTTALNLSYRDPAGIDPEEWARDPDTLVVPNAGEVLYRLR